MTVMKKEEQDKSSSPSLTAEESTDRHSLLKSLQKENFAETT